MTITMADGITHHEYLRIGWLLIVPLGLFLGIFCYLLVPYFYLYPMFFYLNYLLCNIISPDADQIGITSDEGIILRTTKRFWIGFFGALFVSYSFIYAYLIGLVGGHRSVFSHGWIIGTIGRMFYYNIPFYYFCWMFYLYGIRNWNWSLSIGLYESTKMEIWLSPYLLSQFLAWLVGDGIHLILDSKWAKGRLYTPKPSGR